MRFAENPSKIKFFLKLGNRIESLECWVWIAWPAKTSFILSLGILWYLNPHFDEEK
jgi:hypothetical protein